MLGFTERQFFELDEAENASVQEPVIVDFDTK
jgi:hypothetical protein